MKKMLSYRLFSYFYPWRYLLVLPFLFLLISKGVEAYVPYFIGNISNVMLEKQMEYHTLFQAGAFIIALLIGSFVLEVLNVVIKTWIGEKALFSLRNDVYRHIQKLPVSYLDRHPVGELMTRAIHDVDQINLMFTESLIPLFGSAVLFIAIFIGMAFLKLPLFFLMLVILPFVLALTHYFRVNQRRCYDNVRKIVAKLNSFVQENLMGVWTIRSFGLNTREKKAFETLNESLQEANIDTIHYYATFFSGIEWFQGISLIAIFLVLLYLTPAGFEGGVYFSFSLYVLMLFRPLADLADRYNVFQSALAAAARIFHLLDEPCESDLGKRELKEIHEIDFRNVWFAYKNEEWIFKGLNLKIQKGEKVGVVGITGAGKTTLLKLLLRFYPIQKGEILINGISTELYTLASLRSQFSVVLQDPEIFSGTIEDNITFFRQGIDLGQVVREASLSNLIQKLPLRLKHPLLERGKSLSQGERQLISLARAIASDGSVFVLDEATANIDSQSERLIQQTMDRIFKEKTAIVIAHRLSTIQNLSRVIVLCDGVVAEDGTHEALIKRRGIYEKLCRLQFA
jgi:ATP-binding cassette subfamily B protein